VANPAANVWIVVAGPNDQRTVTPGAPTGVASIDPQRLANGQARLMRSGRELVTWTGNREIGRVSAVYDLSPREREERGLIVWLAVASLLGVLVAIALGVIIGRQTINPLGSAIAMQRRFIADASHELRTPLAILQLRAEKLSRDLPSGLRPEVASDLQRLAHDATVMGEVVNDLLDAAQLEFRPQRGDQVDLWVTANDVVERLSPIAQERGVALSMSPAPELAATINGSGRALSRAVTSLIDNALAHTPAGGRIQVDVGAEPGEFTICVWDNGQGLQIDQIDQLLERFGRGTTEGRGRRFGLGLALVEEVARAHGGRLEVRGELGQGAAFTLVLPARRDAAHERV
jgi:signal transduction histidine kinase